MGTPGVALIGFMTELFAVPPRTALSAGGPLDYFSCSYSDEFKRIARNADETKCASFAGGAAALN
jgi:hypothetical protein